MATKLVETTPLQGAVTEIAVDELFGHYTYDMKPDDPAGADSRLLLLYGDNGSGKTTIAQLLFHMLSRAYYRGHLSFLAKTRFKRFHVMFGDCVFVVAERRGQDLDGPYYLVAGNGKTRRELEVRTNDDGSVKSENIDEETHQEFFGSFPTPLATYFLSDNRVLQSDMFADEEEEDWNTEQPQYATIGRGDSRIRVRTNDPRRKIAIEPSILRAETWMRRQTLAASSAGEITTSAVYGEILQRIAHPTSHEPSTEHRQLDELVKSLRSLSERTKEFAEFGLASPVPLDGLLRTFAGVDKTRVDLIANVLEPYVNSIDGRLQALAAIQGRLSTFLRIINAFYKRKTVRLTIEDGIQVLDQDGEPLSPSLLSSGEQQLMLLLCNVLAATGQPSLFIVDEPELSLNVKWQRELLDSLLQLIEGSQVQFVMATHSIELLTRHKSSILKLDSI